MPAGELLKLAGGTPALDVEPLLERPMGALSQGEAQRVALAAAVTRPAALVVLDEPFTALDADAAGALETLLTARAAEALVLVADHEARLAPATRVRVADGTATIVTGEERVRIRTGRAAATPLPRRNARRRGLAGRAPALAGAGGARRAADRGRRDPRGAAALSARACRFDEVGS
jgi:hypothetical protein